MINLVLGWRYLPFNIFATISMSSMRPLVQVPIETCCSLIPTASFTGTTLSTVCGLAIIGSSSLSLILIVFSYTALSSAITGL